MSKATHTPTTTAPRCACEASHALDAIDAVHHAQRGVFALLVMSSSHHELTGEAVSFVASAIADELDKAEAKLLAEDGEPGDDAEPAARDPASPDLDAIEARVQAELDAEAKREPSVDTLFDLWRSHFPDYSTDSEEEQGHKRDTQEAARVAMTTTPARQLREVIAKVTLLEDEFDGGGSPDAMRWRPMLASIVADLERLS